MTGGASGLGEAAVRTLVQRGAKVIVRLRLRPTCVSARLSFAFHFAQICDLNEDAGKKMEEEFGASALFCKVSSCLLCTASA
jgi:NAD(P)-dependent dehydrogenase (short-subunit alcohol dehydrogenase family)